jgi:hypothetical protein
MEFILVEDMIAVVEQYIFEKKGLNVKIEIRYHPFYIQHDLDLLNYCYTIAHEYKKNV